MKTEPFRLKTYVANRVIMINEIISPNVWHHIASELNPTDCASRGLTPIQLVNHPLWWKGLPFLRDPKLEISTSKNQCPQEELPELKTLHLTKEPQLDPESELLKRFSTLTRMQRGMSYVFRFIQAVRHKIRPYIKGILTAKELKNTLNHCIKLTQGQYFSKELILLNQSKFVASLRMLTPILDENGLVRVGGRLSNAPLPYEAKHPILVPKACHLSKLICNYYHTK